MLPKPPTVPPRRPLQEMPSSSRRLELMSMIMASISISGVGTSNWSISALYRGIRSGVSCTMIALRRESA